MYTVEIYSKRNGNTLREKSGFSSVEAAMDWGIAESEPGMSYRFFKTAKPEADVSVPYEKGTYTIQWCNDTELRTVSLSGETETLNFAKGHRSKVDIYADDGDTVEIEFPGGKLATVDKDDFRRLR
jgi:hypothetical protein